MTRVRFRLCRHCRLSAALPAFEIYENPSMAVSRIFRDTTTPRLAISTVNSNWKVSGIFQFTRFRNLGILETSSSLKTIQFDDFEA